MNRYLSPAADGSIAFRSGRRYRMLAVVNGPCDAEDLEDFLERNGFDAIASSTPPEWAEQRPEDWPTEGDLRIAANECPLRISAVYQGEGELRMRPDVPIGKTGASVTIAQAWDYGAAGETAGADAPAGGETRSPLPIVGAAVAGLVGLGIWQHISATRRMEKARAQMLTAETKAEQLSVAERMQSLLDRGYSDTEASAIVDREERASHAEAGHEPHVIYVMP